MKKTILTLSLISCCAVAGFFLVEKVNNDLKEGKFPTSVVSKEIEGATISYVGYDTDKFPLSILKYVVDFPESEKQNFLFDYDSFNKKVYRIKGDSFAQTYTFDDADKHPINKQVKKTLFKLSSSFLDRKDVNRIYRSNNSNIMMSSYIIEFENKKSISEIYRYTSQILPNNENNSNISEEIDVLDGYVNTNAKYKRFNFVFSSKNNGFVLRQLVSKHLENNKPKKSEFKIVYKK